MLGQVVSSREALAAHLAVVGALSRMDAEVPCQVGLAAEGTAAEQAHEWALARVLADMQLEVLLGAHALTAKGAGKAALLALSKHAVQAVLRVAEGVRATVGRHGESKGERVDGVVLFGVGPRLVAAATPAAGSPGT